jgi:hypothetical protein
MPNVKWTNRVESSRLAFCRMQVGLFPGGCGTRIARIPRTRALLGTLPQVMLPMR